MKLSLVIPCYNEQENVKLFYQETIKVLEKYVNNMEWIFINDGSKDNTIEVLKNIYKDSPYDIKVINFSRNFGKEAALLAGLKESQGDYVSIIDADMQQNPKYVKEMVEFLDMNPEYDSVAMVQEERKESKVLVFFKDCFYKLINKLTEVELKASASDFRTLRRNVVESIIGLPERCRFSKGIFAWVGYNTYFAPYEVEERANGVSTWSFWKLFGYAIDGITAFSTTPLVISSILGVIICLLAFCMIAFVVIKTLIWGDPVAGFPTLASLILFAMGIQLIFVGVLGQYLAKVYTEVKDRPAYIIKEKIGVKQRDE